MYISIPNKKLEKTLMSEKNLKKAYNILAVRIMTRINTLQVADNLSMIPTDKPERCHLLDGNYKGCYAVCIDSNWRIIIKPIGNDMPYDKIKIKEIEIIDIVDYHN